jgi:hypothetical protein
MTCLYFSRPVPCFFIKTPSRYAIVCSIKNVMTISWNFHVVIRLGSLSLSFWCFQVYANEMFFSLNIFVAPHLCIVEGGSYKGLEGNF